MTADCWVFKFLRRIMNGEHLMRFQVKTLFSNLFGALWTQLACLRGNVSMVKLIQSKTVVA